MRGPIAGIFDAEGSFRQTVWRVSNTDQEIIARVSDGLRLLAFDFAIETVTPADQ